jgi:Domain of unknown function (DUF4384)
MRIPWTPVAVLILLPASGLTAGPEASQGAKELFYDPVGKSAVSAAAETPSPAATPPPKTPKSLPAVDPQGRRRVTRSHSDLTVAAARSASDQSPPARKILGLSYWIELINGPGEGGASQVTNQRIFRSGERIRLHFRSNTDGEIALIHVGSSGESKVLFPDPAQHLTDRTLVADEDRILPSSKHWFRFDDSPGTEKLLVLFARSKEDLNRFPIRHEMDSIQTTTLLASAKTAQGSKDLVVETENQKVAEIGTYGVNVAGQPVVLEISLQHR